MYYKIIKKLYFISYICSFLIWSFIIIFLLRDKENMENGLLKVEKYVVFVIDEKVY